MVLGGGEWAMDEIFNQIDLIDTDVILPQREEEGEDTQELTNEEIEQREMRGVSRTVEAAYFFRTVLDLHVRDYMEFIRETPKEEEGDRPNIRVSFRMGESKKREIKR